VGGLIVTNYAWEWIFLINIPIGVGAILATIAIVPESKDPLANRRLDWGGLFLSGFGIFALVFALIEGGRLGWTDPLVVSMFFVGVLLLIAFVSWEKRAADPMVKLELFGQRNFLFGNLISLLVAFGMLGIFFPMTLFLQGALGFSPIRAGLTMTPMSIMIMIAAPFAGRLTDRIGARWILVTGLLLMTGGILFITSRITLETSWRTLWPALMVTGTGMGMTFAPMTAVVMMDVPGRIAGSASGILNTTRNIGQVLGIAVLGSLLQSRLVTHTSTRLEQFDLEDQQRDQIVGLARNSRFEEVARVIPPELSEPILGGLRLAFVDSLHNTFIVGAVACFFGALAAWQIRNPARRQAPVVAPATESAVRAG